MNKVHYYPDNETKSIITTGKTTTASKRAVSDVR
jgi:hypothetical protein